MPHITQHRPSTDWTCRDPVRDARSPGSQVKGQCEFCGRRLRWVHLLRHPDWPSVAEAGCCCAASLCFGYDAAAAERELINRMARLTRFVDPKGWRPSRNTSKNICREVRMPNNRILKVTIFLNNGQYGICVANRRGDDAYFHPMRYSSQVEAMDVAFELIELGKEELRPSQR